MRLGTEARIVQPELGLGDLARLRAERGLSVSVCLPALNEEATIGGICRACGLLLENDVVQQLVVVDSGSSDATRDEARAAGAEVYEARHLAPGEPDEPLGKGGALWRSLGVATGDILVWIDSDTRNFSERFVTALLEPLLKDSSLRLTKAFYERPFVSEQQTLGTGGARVTELMFRPLCQLLFPELTGIVQPLSGEYAGYRDDLLELPFFSGYGVEAGLLIDVVQAHGSGTIAQVDLGSRIHHNQDVPALGRMAFEIMQVMMLRAQQLGRLQMNVDWPVWFRQYEAGPAGVSSRDHEIRVRELPPMKNFLSATGGG